MDIYNFIINRRTVRRFKNIPIPRDLLDRCLNAGRLAPSAGNRQTNEFFVVTDEALMAQVFTCFVWGRPLGEEGPPREGHRPKAYIVILKNTNLSKASVNDYDTGEAAENMILVAEAEGVGSCQFAAMNKDKLRQILNIPEHCEIHIALALGYSDETHVVEPFTGSVDYWRDKDSVHHVPKRPLESIVHWNAY